MLRPRARGPLRAALRLRIPGPPLAVQRHATCPMTASCSPAPARPSAASCSTCLLYTSPSPRD
eukprot:9714945-Alexandrium_andersonii.AAC.1